MSNQIAFVLWGMIAQLALVHVVYFLDETLNLLTIDKNWKGGKLSSYFLLVKQSLVANNDSHKMEESVLSQNVQIILDIGCKKSVLDVSDECEILIQKLANNDIESDRKYHMFALSLSDTSQQVFATYGAP